MNTFYMADNDVPPRENPVIGPDGQPVAIIALYIGGDTPYVSTPAQWAERRETHRLPIYTRSNPIDAVQAQQDAAAALRQLKAIGAPQGIRVGLDLETAVNGAYVSEFNRLLADAGYLVVKYGSRSYVFQNPPTDGGTWDAQWNYTPHLNTGSVATQYVNDTHIGKDYDLSVAVDDGHWWEVGTEPVPPPPPPGDTYQERATHNTFTPVAVDGSFGPATTRALQFVLGVATDGIFGPVSKRALQEMLGVAVDGDIGPITVHALQVKVSDPSPDGVWGPQTTTCLQVALNHGTLY